MQAVQRPLLVRPDLERVGEGNETRIDTAFE